MSDRNPGSGALRPSDEAIAKRAYELYLQRGSLSGYEMDDWLQAEAELAAAATSSASAEADESTDGQAPVSTTRVNRGETLPTGPRDRHGGRRHLRQ